METNNEHINNLFKQKFEDFAPQPPERVWAGIASALDKGAAPVWYNTLIAKVVAIAVGVAILLGSYWLFLKKNPQPDNNLKVEAAYQNTTKNEAVIDSVSGKNMQETDIARQTSKRKNANTQYVDNNIEINQEENIALPVKTSASGNYKGQNKSGATNQAKPLTESQIQPSRLKNNQQLALSGNNSEYYEKVVSIEWMQKKSVSLNNIVSISMAKPDPVNNNAQHFSEKKQTGNWVLGLYFSPEFIFDPFDSLTIQNSYALKFEPTYYINNHWFVRPGIGLSYARDKGFVKANYLSWDYLGSYEDVVDVTFDTVGNTITPVYHTQTRDVYDSIMHVTVSEETNRYLYLQTSVVFGYHNHVNKFGWSVYAGSQVNFILAEKRDNPIKGDGSVTYMKYSLADRHSPQYGLKLGVGMDYAIAKKWLVTVEPEYNYFFNGINGGDIYSKPLSGIGLRFGLIYTIK